MKDLTPVFFELRKILAPYTTKLDVGKEDATELTLFTQPIAALGGPMFFGAVQIQKSYVSFHLMPVYVKPELLIGMSPELGRRMQGKSCFNFKAIDKVLFKELARLTKAGFASFKALGYR
jgi:hypothetical protein